MKHITALLICFVLVMQPCFASDEPPVFDNPEWLYYEFNVEGVRDKYPLPKDYDVEMAVATVGLILSGWYLVVLGLGGVAAIAWSK